MNRSEKEKALKEIVERLREEFHPETIYLFGSHAWGSPGGDSDLDILVIVSDSEETATARAQRAYARKAGIMVPMDIVVQTRAQFDRFLTVKASLAHRVARDGRVLYAGHPETLA
ncbi:MAG: nucleotidyltransferase domain-containing protein [Deltaproteobacteria bacterium]|nr:nucleotidyltransferase domain-containing protein [Deltaproteobacteria bacterium]